MKTIYKLRRRILVLLLVFYIFVYLLRLSDIPYISDHATNFALCGGILVLSTYSELVGKGLRQLSLILATGLWALVNVVVEFYVDVDVIKLPGIEFVNFNTPDPADALFGLLGILLFSTILLKFGDKIEQT